MNALDIALVVLLGWSTYRGWQTGLLRSLLGLAGLVFGYILALAYGQPFGLALTGDDSTLCGILGIVVVFFGTILVVHFVARFVKAFLHATPLGAFDAAGGGLLGLAQGVLAFGLLLVLAYSYPIHSKIPEQIEGSRLARPIQSGALALVDAIKVILPSVKEALEDLDIRGPDDTPPVVETLKTGADAARQKLESVVKESKKRLEDATK